MTAPSVLCVGHTNWDIVIHSDEIPAPDHSAPINGDHASSGGSATNTALGLASLGNNTTILSSLGEDQYGKRVVDALVDAGVTPVMKTGEHPTTLIYALITPGDDPRYLHQNVQLGDFGLEELDSETWDDIDHVHLTTFDKEIASRIAQQAKADGKTVSFNPTQGYGAEDFTPVVEAADIVIMNDETEEDIFRDRHNLSEVVEDGTCVVITHGADGSTAYNPTGVYSHPGYPSDDVADTIGAGDAYTAGFITEWLQRNGVKNALKHGNACGSYVVTQVGAPDTLDHDWIDQLIQDEPNTQAPPESP